VSDILNHQALFVEDDMALIRFFPVYNSSASLFPKEIEKTSPEEVQSFNLLPC
jgi:hypothetical protein